MKGSEIHLVDSDRSSVVEAIGYDEREGGLFVQFRSTGAVWRYPRISVEMYRNLLAADSLGAFVSSVIKKERKGEKVEMKDWLLFNELSRQVSVESRQAAYESANKDLFEQLRNNPRCLGF